ncbi:hypothetical protein AU074_13965 [Pseudomonas sp. ATCC PTA-122608]|uniref:hypothetical protein n=1 Tax=Pseudomonas sp. ATCC PTA-122608 TaxID=1771311 RepID=UPI00096BCA76|nr:hypothetical protein [Pseudomonas sp. ATCC PTA-122608]OLY72277.1 hypothetical protein AU074_13965 [Pseudomonas sp. ATCC PTA-122608]
MNLSINEIKDGEFDSYIKVFGYAYRMIAAVNMANRLSGVILMIVTHKMDANNELMLSTAELDKALGIGDASTRTKAMNILRLSNLVEIKYDNRFGIYRVRVNTKAYQRGRKKRTPNKNKLFSEDLNFDILGNDGLIKQSAIDGYKVNPARKVKNVGAV